MISNNENNNTINQRISTEQKVENSKKEKNICYFCNRGMDNVYTFSKCNHKVCTFCFYERLFSKHIQEFYCNTELQIKCKCEIGYKKITLLDLLNLLKAKNELDEKEEEENKDEISKKIIEGCECSNNEDEKGKKFSEFFCVDCLKYVCKQCKLEKTNTHFKHRVLNSKHLIKMIKDNIKKIELKNIDVKTFIDNCDKLSEIFDDLIEKHLNNTIDKIDELIKSAKKLKEDYINTYKNKLGNYIKIFKYIKVFYLNYYKDLKDELKIIEAEKNNIYKLKYLNNISYEFVDLKMTHSDFVEKQVIQMKEIIDKLINKRNLIDGKFIFKKLKKGYKMGEKFQAHQKFINGLIVTNNNQIVTASNDFYMKVWDPSASKVAKQEEKVKIISLYSLKNGKIIASNDNNIFIYELNDKNEYEVFQSLTKHDKKIFALAQLDDGNIISGGIDKKIIFWEENSNSKQYNDRQIIDTKNEIKNIITLNDFKIAYSSFNEDGVINIMGTKTNLVDNKIVSTDYFDICELKEHKGKVSCMCKLNQGYFVSGGADTKKKLDHNIYIWKPLGNKFCLSQTLINAHEADINSIILLRDGRFASSSKDHTIKIWRIYFERGDNKFNYVLSQNIKEYKHGLYNLIQLNDNRIVSTTSDNLLVFWNNVDGIF